MSGECWDMCVWQVSLILILICLLWDTDWCFSTSEPFTYLFPRPSSTKCTGVCWRPRMPVFNCLLIDSAIAVGDNKLPPAWEKGGGRQVERVGVCGIHRVPNLCLHYSYIRHFYLCSKEQWRNAQWNGSNTDSLLVMVYLHRSVHIGCVWKDGVSVQR